MAEGGSDRIGFRRDKSAIAGHSGNQPDTEWNDAGDGGIVGIAGHKLGKAAFYKSFMMAKPKLLEPVILEKEMEPQMDVNGRRLSMNWIDSSTHLLDESWIYRKPLRINVYLRSSAVHFSI